METIILKYGIYTLRNIMGFLDAEMDIIDRGSLKQFLESQKSINNRNDNYREFAGPFWEGNVYLISKNKDILTIIDEVALDNGPNELRAISKMEMNDFVTILKDENLRNDIQKYIDTFIYPMGTVVRLKDNSRSDKLSEYSYMITDRFVLKDESSKEYYEYKANIYPIGSLPSGKGIMFNNEDISIVQFLGYETEMDKKLVEDVKKKLEEKGISKIIVDVK